MTHWPVAAAMMSLVEVQGSDTADYSTAAAGVVVNIATGASNDGDGGVDTNSIENVTGSAFADTLTGGAAATSFAAAAAKRHHHRWRW